MSITSPACCAESAHICYVPNVADSQVYEVEADGDTEALGGPETRKPSQVLARRVREHRELHKISQTELAIRLTEEFEWKVDRTVIARIETRKRAVSVDELFLLAAALDTAPAVLLTPADESELMLPTPARPMTSNRVRTWIADQVRLWEQDRVRADLSHRAAWTRTHAAEEQFDRLGQELAAIYGATSMEEIDWDVELTPRQRADEEVLQIRWEIAGRRHNWESHIGAWPWPDLRDQLMVLDAHSERVAAVARKKWKHSALAEIHKRQAKDEQRVITTAHEASSSLRAKVQAVLDVLDVLVQAVSPQPLAGPPKPASAVPQRPEPRRKDTAPA
jgi:transcriptional regulator with XRE-family HTH domain